MRDSSLPEHDARRTLREVDRIRLPRHSSDGGFDHAAVDPVTDRLFVAHTSNHAVEVVDLARRAHLRTLDGLPGVAGVWVDAGGRFLFTSNRGEDSASVFRIDERGEEELFRVPTGVRPNGMAFDPGRALWLIAGVGDAGSSNAPPTLTFVDVRRKKVVRTVRAPGRTRWATYHAPTDAFYVNVADPPSIVGVSAQDPSSIARHLPMPAAGPHGLEQDPDGEHLYCACDAAVLLQVNVRSGAVRHVGALAGTPDVLWVDRSRGRLYAATDEPATVEVVRTGTPVRLATVPTAPGAHTLTVDEKRHEVHVFLPDSCEDLVLGDGGEPRP